MALNRDQKNRGLLIPYVSCHCDQTHLKELTFLKYQLLSNLFLKPISEILSNIFTWEDSRAQRKWQLGWCRLRWRKIVPAQKDNDDFDDEEDEEDDDDEDDDDFDDDNADNDDGVCKRLYSDKIMKLKTDIDQWWFDGNIVEF